MYIVDLKDLIAENETLEGALAESRGLWDSLYERMDSSETLWIIAPNAYRDGVMWPVAMFAADYIREEAGFALKNTITVHTISDRGADMVSAYDDILFLVKDKREYLFYKDEIRVSHVYEGNEWGDGREKGNSAYHDTEVRRYNPDGKDPGNVWLEEDRSQTPNQEVDATAPISFEEAIRRCIRVGSQEEEAVHTVWGSEFEDIVADENRLFSALDADELRSEIEVNS
ncbi:DNA methyltransferase [Haloarcula rubripromontorii]|uniref:DNA methyltransferase n=1 Tax=Haloarcula rubripromontorii TaxID=1705562 RepID=UPI00345B68F8